MPARRWLAAHHKVRAPKEIRADKLLLAGLRLGIRETLDFLLTIGPSFEQFEAWVLENNNGTIEPVHVQRLNSALRGDGGFALESILDEPVLLGTIWRFGTRMAMWWSKTL